MNDDALDIFISYARENRTTAAQLAAVLQQHGLSVWWDREILGGAEFAEVIERELTRARVAIVLWSAESVQSPFVRDECARALQTGKLLPVRIEDVALPLGFGQLHTLDLIDWDGDHDIEELFELFKHIGRKLQGESAPIEEKVRRSGIRFARRRTLMTAGGAAAAVVAAWFGWTALFGRNTARARQLTADALEKFEAKQFDPARFLLNQALEVDSEYAPALFYRAQVLVQSGAPDEAAADLKRAIALRRGLDDAQLRDARGWLDELVAKVAGPAPVMRVASVETAAVTEPGSAPAPAPPPPAAPAATPPPVASSGSQGSASVRAPQAATEIPKTRGLALPGIGPLFGSGGSGAAKPSAPLPAARPSTGKASAAKPPATPPAAALPDDPKLPTVPPDDAMRARLLAEVERMFGTVKDARMAATTSLIVDPEATSDAVPLATDRALIVQREGVPADQALLSGVINTLVLIQSATPATLALHAAAIGKLLDAAKANGPQTAELVASVAGALAGAESQTPIVFIQIASASQRSIASTISARLRRAGYQVPAEEVVGSRAPSRTEIRVQGRSDRSLARWMINATERLTEAPVALVTLRNVKPKRDTYELWLGATL